MAKRNQPAPRPAAPGEWSIVLATSEAASGWEALCQQAPGPLAALFDRLTADPRNVVNSARQHRLRGSLGSASIKGTALEQWEYEITGGGRVRYCPDDDRHTVWIVAAGTGHPKDTE